MVLINCVTLTLLGAEQQKGSAPAPKDSKAYVSLHTAGPRQAVGDRRQGERKWQVA